MHLVINLLGFLGMRRDVPPTLLDVTPASALPMRELVNLDPSELPVLTPRDCLEVLETVTNGTSDVPPFPRCKV